jgi:hypothetical protein
MSSDPDETTKEGRHERSPGVAWLAGRTGKSPAELTGSPSAGVAALGDALRELAGLAVRLESGDADVREAAQAEVQGLRGQVDAAPRPFETFGKRVAQILRETAERLDHDEGTRAQDPVVPDLEEPAPN